MGRILYMKTNSLEGKEKKYNTRLNPTKPIGCSTKLVQ